MEPTEMQDTATESPPRVDLYWLPVGAGGRVVKVCSGVFERFAAWFGRRPRRSLYHSALEVVTAGDRTVIEMTPVPRGDRPESRGVVASAPVGLRWAGRFRIFRYEVRRWSGGAIPDLQFAVGGPVRVADGDPAALQVLAATPLVPRLVWGRDELHAGEMWNSNSVIAWILSTAGIETAPIVPPPDGRAPGWDSGLVLAERTRAAGAVRS